MSGKTLGYCVRNCYIESFSLQLKLFFTIYLIQRCVFREMRPRKLKSFHNQVSVFVSRKMTHKLPYPQKRYSTVLFYLSNCTLLLEYDSLFRFFSILATTLGHHDSASGIFCVGFVLVKALVKYLLLEVLCREMN